MIQRTYPIGSRQKQQNRVDIEMITLEASDSMLSGIMVDDSDVSVVLLH